MLWPVAGLPVRLPARSRFAKLHLLVVSGTPCWVPVFPSNAISTLVIGIRSCEQIESQAAEAEKKLLIKDRQCKSYSIADITSDVLIHDPY